MTTLEAPWECIFVDDGSHDDSLARLANLQQRHPQCRIISLSRNFGHQAALLAGLQASRGDCVITMDGDLQHPPHIIPQLLVQWKNGAHIVNTRRVDRRQLNLKRLTSGLFYRLFSSLSGQRLLPGMADFRLLDRQVVETLSQTQERALFLRGILQWLGFRQAIVDYEPAKRLSGKSGYSTGKMLHLAMDGITSFSLIPLRMATYLGFLFSFASFAYLSYALYGWWYTSHNIVGWTSVVGSVLFLGGIQLICLGIMGEYIGKIYLEVKHRPHYVIEKTLGFDDE